MQSYQRGQVVPCATQNHQFYNARGYPKIQQGTMYMTYAPYLSNPPYLKQELIGCMTYAPYPQYSQQEIGYLTYASYPLYSQQEIEAHLLQDPMANDIVLYDQRDQNCLFQNLYRRETMPEYRNGEMVMVRCNQQKWLNGVIQKMSTQGMQIWIIDANVLVNVPLVLLPTCVLKMTTYSALESLPQVEPMWTITNHGGYQNMLIQCVRPTHLSHCQLSYVLDNNVCAIFKLHVSNTIDIVSPWNCCHQVHNRCLQLQMQQCSTIICPSCNENFLQQLKFSKYSRCAHPSPSNGQQQRFDLECTCGFKTVMIGNINEAIFCPNCHQPLNVNSMMEDMESGQALNNMNINPTMVKIQNRYLSTSMIRNPRTKRIQSEEPSINMDLLCASSKPKREILESSESSKIQERERFFNVQDSRFGWPMQSFSGHNRLEAIEEGPKITTSSLESTTIEERGEEPFHFPSYLQATSETFENNNISYQNVVAMRSNDQDVQPPSHFQNSLQDGLLYKLLHTHFTKSQNKQDGSLGVSYPTPTTPIQSKRPNSQILLQDGIVDAIPLSLTNLIQRKQSASGSSLQNDFKDAPFPAPITFFQNELWKDNGFDTKQLTTSLSKDALVPLIKLTEVEEASKSTEQLEMDKTTNTTIEGYKLWKKESKPNTTMASTKDQSLGKKASQTITSIVEIEGPKIWEKAYPSEIDTNYETTKDLKLRKKVSETIRKFGLSEGQKLGKRTSESNTIISDIDVEKLWKKTSEPNTKFATIKDHRLEKIERVGSSHDFVASSSSVAPMYTNHFDGTSKRQKLWRNGSTIDWSKKLVSDDEIEEREEVYSSMYPSSAPMYVNHFADFVKLAMGASSSIAKDIIASASSSTSSSILNSPLQLESITPTRISPPPTFFTRVSSLFTKAPTWIIHSKNLDEATSTSPIWITVIKDGVDSRKDDK